MEDGDSLRTRLVWVPSFVVGAAAATSAAVAVALLLYSGEGMLRSLTLIVAVELLAFGVGLAGPSSGRDWARTVEALRIRWLNVLIAFLAASVFAVAWTFGGGFGAEQGTQALGLALLGALPLYACGRLLTAISSVSAGVVRSSPGAFASLGAALGVLISGSTGLSRLGAPSLLLFFLVALSGTALMQGSVLGDLREVLDGGDAAPTGVEHGAGPEAELEPEQHFS